MSESDKVLGCPNKCPYVLALEEEIRNLNDKINNLNKDFLTSAWNRHHLDEMLNSEYKDKIEKNWYYNLIMIDINNLHEYNRIHGYQKGDEYIKNIYNNIKEEIKNQKVSAKIYRTGGDEFIIIYQPYDKLDLSNIKNIEYGISYFDKNRPFRFAIDETDKQIINKKMKSS